LSGTGEARRVPHFSSLLREVGSSAAGRTACLPQTAQAPLPPSLRKVREEWGAHRVITAGEIEIRTTQAPRKL